MQILAMLTMLIDHLGIVLFPDNPWFRSIGRLAMPLYAHALALGYGRTRSFRRYALRLAAIALLSQLPYQYALLAPDEPFEFNVVFTLLVSLAVMRLIDLAAAASVSGNAPSSRRIAASAGIAAGGCLLLELLPFDYGAYLLLLVLIYRYARGQTALALHFFLNAIFLLYKFPAFQMLSLISTLLVAFAPKALEAADRRIRVPRPLWLSFYPAHLAALAAIRQFAIL